MNEDGESTLRNLRRGLLLVGGRRRRRDAEESISVLWKVEVARGKKFESTKTRPRRSVLEVNLRTRRLNVFGTVISEDLDDDVLGVEER